MFLLLKIILCIDNSKNDFIFKLKRKEKSIFVLNNLLVMLIFIRAIVLLLFFLIFDKNLKQKFVRTDKYKMTWFHFRWLLMKSCHILGYCNLFFLCVFIYFFYCYSYTNYYYYFLFICLFDFFQLISSFRQCVLVFILFLIMFDKNHYICSYISNIPGYFNLYNWIDDFVELHIASTIYSFFYFNDYIFHY